ncbi:MAG: hypothetical protein IJW92_00715 [Clostridia bacterium]|nr:hypothetical protein [Clostridia bacterium]
MNTEKIELHASVREGYQILLRADAELLLPTEQLKIREFYQSLAERCMNWATDVHGEMLKKEFSALETVHEKSAFRTQQYRFRMRVAHEDGETAAILCESKLLRQRREPQNSYHRLSHVWLLAEENILPFSQILKRFDLKTTTKELGFVPDGIYPENGEMVFFKNPSATDAFREEKRPLSL